MRDGLTGLYNHSLLIELFQKEFENQEGKNRSIAFAMLDVDFYKKVNDSYGHTSGDVILKEISSIINSTVEDSRIVGRYGGEEFGVVFTDLPLDKIQEICEDIRKNIEEYEFKIGDKFIKVTISIGISYKALAENMSWSEMIEKADKALYKAKNSGRNRVESNI